MSAVLTYKNEPAANYRGGITRELSAREQQVLKLIALGWRITQIAAELGITRKAIAIYRDNALRKLNLADVRELVQFAWRKGIVT